MVILPLPSLLENSLILIISQVLFFEGLVEDTPVINQFPKRSYFFFGGALPSTLRN